MATIALYDGQRDNIEFATPVFEHFICKATLFISGKINATEFNEFTGTEDLGQVHIKVMDHAHDLVVRSMSSIRNGDRRSLAQKDIAKSVT